MVIHYDMTTGEVIASERDTTAAGPAPEGPAPTALRLLSVAEGKAAHGPQGPAAAVLMQPIERLIRENC